MTTTPTTALLHRQVYDALLGDIESAALPRGSRLPPERVLCERFGVSRATLRRALRELADRGLIESAVGRGTFVSGGYFSDPPNTLRSFSELGLARGLVPSARVLASRSRPADLDEAVALGLAPGATLFELERLRLLDGNPIAVDRAIVPLARAPGVADGDYRTASLYAAVEAAGERLTRGEYLVRAAAADERLAALLDVVVGEPLLVAASTTYSASGAVVVMDETSYRSDRYRFTFSLVRR